MRKKHVLLLCIIALLSLCLLTSCKGNKEENKKSDQKQEVELPVDNLEDDSAEEEDTTKDSASGVNNAGAPVNKTEKPTGSVDASEKNDEAEGNREDSQLSDDPSSEEEGNGVITPEPDLDEKEEQKDSEEETSERNPIILPTIPLN